MISNPLITSYANIASVFSQIVQKKENIEWFFLNYSNLCWQHETDELIPCNYDNFNNYHNLLNSPFLCVFAEDANRFTSKNVISWIEQGYSVLCPINTYKMGITINNAFVHDIFITAVNNGKYEVFDFWPPKFKWDSRFIPIETVHNAIDISNSHLYNALIIMKANQNNLYFLIDSMKEVIKKYLQKRENSGYQTTGIEIYCAFAKYIDFIPSYSVLPIANFQILIDHFSLLKCILPDILEQKFRYALDIREEINKDISTMLRQAIQLRNYVLKIWYSKKNEVFWKEKINDVLYSLQMQERGFWEVILKTI